MTLLASTTWMPSLWTLQEWGDLLPAEFNVAQWDVDWVSAGKILIQMGILSSILYVVYSKIIHKNYAEQILKGLFVILIGFILLWGISRLAGFAMLEVVFGASIQLLIIGLIVIFQPELRRLLIYLGQADWFASQGGVLNSEEKKAEFLVRELAESVRFLSKSKTGALIVLEPSTTSKAPYLEAGTPIDAKLSTELLLTIFHTNAPLHDGAVVINEENRIVSAGVLLPLTEDPNLSWRYGTRHRAAIGLSEISDAKCIVVSEETGGISIAEGGNLEKLANSEELKKYLERLFHLSGKSTIKRQKLLSGADRAKLFFKSVEAKGEDSEGSRSWWSLGRSLVFGIGNSGRGTSDGAMGQSSSSGNRSVESHLSPGESAVDALEDSQGSEGERASEYSDKSRPKI